METIYFVSHVSREVAELLRKVDFDWSSIGYYNKLGFFHNAISQHDELKVPALDVAQRWLREVKHLDISIHYDPTIKIQPYIYSIYDVDKKFDDIFGIISPVTHSYSDGYFYTYEEAQEAGIKKALEIILEEGK